MNKKMMEVDAILHRHPTLLDKPVCYIECVICFKVRYNNTLMHIIARDGLEVPNLKRFHPDLSLLNTWNETPLMTAAYTGNFNVFIYCIEFTFIKVLYEFLDYLYEIEDKELAKRCIDSDASGPTLLMLCTIHNAIVSIKKLLSLFSPAMKKYNELTPLEYAEQEGFTELVDLFNLKISQRYPFVLYFSYQ